MREAGARHSRPAHADHGRFRDCPPTLTGMACRISELVIDCADPDRLAAFWSEVLGYVELGREDDGSIEIGPSDAGFGGPQPTLVLSPGSDARTGKLPLHIDVNATDRDQDAELERLLGLGARPAEVGQALHRELARPGRPRRQRILPPAPPAPAPLTRASQRRTARPQGEAGCLPGDRIRAKTRRGNSTREDGSTGPVLP